MTKYTQVQLLAMTNEQMDEIVALAQGWHKERYSFRVAWATKSKAIQHQVDNYHPTTYKDQAWDLMVKCELIVNVRTYFTKVAYDGLDDNDIIEHHDPLIAVVIASILHLQGSE